MMMLMGFVGMVLMMAFSGVLAPLMVANNAAIMANVLRFLAIALFFVLFYRLFEAIIKV